MFKFLFLDAWPFEIIRGFQKRLHAPEPCGANPIFGPERPWERLCTQMMGSVLHDPADGLFKMWYYAGGPLPDDLKEIWHVCYAESEDGFTWRRPDLDVIDWQGRPSNMVLERNGGSILLDEADADPARRFKLMSSRGQWIKAWASPDGIHWTLLRDPGVINTYSDSHVGLWRDPDSGLYAITHRMGGSRRVWRSESADLLTWTRPILAVEPDVNDPPQTQFNGMPAFAYGHFTLGLVQLLNTVESDLRWEKYEGTLTVELAHSRHGGAWHRTMRGEEFQPLGAPGTWNAGMIYPTAPVLLNDEIRFYYSGTPFGHGGDPNDTVIQNRPYYITHATRIGAASLRIDGFVSLDAGDAPAELLTRAFAVTTPEVFLNARVFEGGEARCQVEGLDGKPIPGFSLEACIPIRGDSIRHEIHWTDAPDPTRITNTPIRLRLQARRAELYSLALPDGELDGPNFSFTEPKFVNPLQDLPDFNMK